MLSPIDKMAENHKGVLIHLNHVFQYFILKADNFVTSCLLISATKPLLKGVYSERKDRQMLSFNPIALRKAKIVYNFGLSERNRVKLTYIWKGDSNENFFP